MSFWSDDINADEVLSPEDIMKDAGDELHSRTGKLIVSIRKSRLDDRVVLAFEVLNRETQRACTLLEVSHRTDQSFPVLINPPEWDIPNFLKRRRYVPGKRGAFASLGALAAAQQMMGEPGRYVENEWVCATPSEFKDKLTKLFDQDRVKYRIISLLTETGIEEAPKEEAEGRD